ncbi:hypothetical protein [Streptomyces purpurogeneiscleroticus]|uniref:hypothetical protein n=1 Tax=Streptomyces purpurogeneiscleroticus TaxID=68259 RepID=UPI001CBA7844|nr:hypothetical protein [Streptomyces purpurogeneiscleroticus]MBZ4017164.1 hypothetical protein [Streptomyces purpurogeneiscleroticus]
MPTERPQGVKDIVRLFNECRTRGQGDRELPVITLLGRRGSGKTTTLRWLGYLASNRPNAFYDFASAVPKRPHEVAARLALGLSYRLPRQPAVHFPRLALGLLVVRAGLTIDSADARRVRAELKQALRQAKENTEAYERTNGVIEGVALLQDLNVVQLPGLNLVLKLVQFGLPRLPVSVMWRTGLTWYADSPNRPVDALMKLNELAGSEAAADVEEVDRLLCGAFLEDLRDHYARHPRDKECVVLLDNIDAPQGRKFLDLLVRIREVNASSDRANDPLLVVATAANARSVPGPYARDFPAELRIRTPEQASYTDWQDSIPRPASTTKWHWYPVQLRDLTEPEVATLAEQAASTVVRATPLIHRLSYGHPWSARVLLDATYAIVVERSGGAAELRHILDHAPPLPGPPDAPTDSEDPAAVGEPMTLDEAARQYLLRDLSEGQRAALVVCSAARAFESAVDAGILEEYDQLTKDTLRRDIDARLWLIPPVPEDANTRGGQGSGYLEHCRDPEENKPTGVLHPWLRLVLLQALAQHEPDGSTGWVAAHTALRDWHRREQQTQHHRLDALYHSLALNDLNQVVAHLAGQFTELPGTDQWLYELYAITAAPMLLPVAPRQRGERDPSPSDRVRELAARLAPGALEEHWALTMLVTALWLAADPRNRVANSTPELNSTIAAMFHTLAALPHSGAAGLLREAERYEPRP